MMLAIVLVGKADARPDINVAKIAQDSKGPGLDLQLCLGRPIFNPGIRIIIPGLKIGLPMAALTNLPWETYFQP